MTSVSNVNISNLDQFYKFQLLLNITEQSIKSILVASALAPAGWLDKRQWPAVLAGVLLALLLQELGQLSFFLQLIVSTTRIDWKDNDYYWKEGLWWHVIDIDMLPFFERDFLDGGPLEEKRLLALLYLLPLLRLDLGQSFIEIIIPSSRQKLLLWSAKKSTCKYTTNSIWKIHDWPMGVNKQLS